MVQRPGSVPVRLEDGEGLDTAAPCQPLLLPEPGGGGRQLPQTGRAGEALHSACTAEEGVGNAAAAPLTATGQGGS